MKFHQLSKANIKKKIIKKGNNFKTIYNRDLKYLKSVRLLNTQTMDWKFKVKTVKWMVKQVLHVHLQKQPEFQKIRYCLAYFCSQLN